VRERDNLENRGIDGRIILDGSSESGMGGMDWIDMAQDRDKWQALANVVINFQVP
jgi:hypothetical protein